MKKTKFSEQQIAFILRQAEEGATVGEVCRKAGISEATYYNWRKKYGGLMPSEMKRLTHDCTVFLSNASLGLTMLRHNCQQLSPCLCICSARAVGKSGGSSQGPGSAGGNSMMGRGLGPGFDVDGPRGDPERVVRGMGTKASVARRFLVFLLWTNGFGGRQWWGSRGGSFGISRIRASSPYFNRLLAERSRATSIPLSSAICGQFGRWPT